MKIEKITKVGFYYKVSFSDDRVIKFHESIIIKYKWFKKNIMIDEMTLEKAIVENEFYLALDKGISYLKRPRSRKEVSIYLSKKYEKDLVSEVVKKLTDLNLIDDYKYALYFIEISQKKSSGINKIKNTLLLNGVKVDIVEKALSNYDFTLDVINCEKVLIKYLPSLKRESTKQAYFKAKNYLISKGFSNDIITITIEKNAEKIDNISDDDTLLLKHFNKLKAKYDIKNKKDKDKIIRSLINKGFNLSQILKLFEGGELYD